MQGRVAVRHRERRAGRAVDVGGGRAAHARAALPLVLEEVRLRARPAAQRRDEERAGLQARRRRDRHRARRDRLERQRVDAEAGRARQQARRAEAHSRATRRRGSCPGRRSWRPSLIWPQCRPSSIVAQTPCSVPTTARSAPNWPPDGGVRRIARLPPAAGRVCPSPPSISNQVAPPFFDSKTWLDVDAYSRLGSPGVISIRKTCSSGSPSEASSHERPRSPETQTPSAARGVRRDAAGRGRQVVDGLDVRHARRLVPCRPAVGRVVDAVRPGAGGRDGHVLAGRVVEEDRLDAAEVQLARARALADRSPVAVRRRLEQAARRRCVEVAVGPEADLADVLRAGRRVEPAVLLRPWPERRRARGEDAAGLTRGEQLGPEEVERADGDVGIRRHPAGPLVGLDGLRLGGQDHEDQRCQRHDSPVHAATLTGSRGGRSLNPVSTLLRRPRSAGFVAHLRAADALLGNQSVFDPLVHKGCTTAHRWWRCAAGRQGQKCPRLAISPERGAFRPRLPAWRQTCSVELRGPCRPRRARRDGPFTCAVGACEQEGTDPLLAPPAPAEDHREWRLLQGQEGAPLLVAQ